MGKVLEWINLDPHGHATLSKAAKSQHYIFVSSVSESQIECYSKAPRDGDLGQYLLHRASPIIRRVLSRSATLSLACSFVANVAALSILSEWQ